MTSARLPVASAPRPAPFLLDQQAAVRLTGGVWHGAAREVEVHGASIDSRAVRRGNLFACLPGASHDGHDFAATAVGDGAALILATRPVAVPVPVLVVADVASALAALATEFRRRYQGATWIGVTGSNGKTTVKELIALACGAGGAVHATRGNLNNHLGVPVTVLNTPPAVRFAVIELGANHPGEIAALAAIAQPQLGVITAIGPAHLEGFGSLLGVARAKGELFAALPAGAPALLGLHGLEAAARANGQDAAALLAALRERAAGRRLSEIGSPALPVAGDLRDAGITLRTATGSVDLALLGAHNLANAALAWRAAVAAGVPAEAALRALGAISAVSGRLRARPATGGHLVLDDSYNANPGSMSAGLNVLACYAGRRLAVLGGMGELGDGSAAGHAQVGAEAARLALPLLTVGDRARAILDAYRAAGGPDGEHAADREAALPLIARRLAAGATTILVKASRSAGLETVVRALVDAPTGRHARVSTP